MNRVVGHDGQICRQKPAMPPGGLCQISRPRFLVALEEELGAIGGIYPGGAPGVQDAQQGGDRSLVVAGGAGLDPPVGVHRFARSRPSIYDLPAGLDGSGSQYQCPGTLLGPVGGIHWLAVVVAVEEDGGFVRIADLAVYQGLAPRLNQLGIESNSWSRATLRPWLLSR